MIPGLCSLVYPSSLNSSGGMTAYAHPVALYGTDGQTSIGPSTASELGGASAFTYAWNFQSGSSSVTAVSPTSSATNFSCGSLSSGDVISAVYSCTIIDSASRTATTNQVQLNFFSS